MPLLFNATLICEVAALPLLVNVPSLLTAAVAPVSAPPRLVALTVIPLVVV